MVPFQEVHFFLAGNYASQMVAADFNKDGMVDVLVTNKFFSQKYCCIYSMIPFYISRFEAYLFMNFFNNVKTPVILIQVNIIDNTLCHRRKEVMYLRW